MIDYLALAIGHGLLVLGLLRLVLRAELDRDPLLEELDQSARTKRMEATRRRGKAARTASAAENADSKAEAR
ncbi:MAG: hypothetical protein AAF494_01460 [Pseudomonadota bacterium]